MRFGFEKENDPFSFSKLIKQVMHSLKVIEIEKQEFFANCPDFNLMDAFRAMDAEGKGFITPVELTVGLMDL